MSAVFADNVKKTEKRGLSGLGYGYRGLGYGDYGYGGNLLGYYSKPLYGGYYNGYGENIFYFHFANIIFNRNKF